MSESKRPTDEKLTVENYRVYQTVWAHKNGWNGCPRAIFFLTYLWEIAVLSSYLDIFTDLITVISKLKCGGDCLL